MDFLQRSGAPAVTRFSRGVWSRFSGKYRKHRSQIINVVSICFIVFTQVLFRDLGQSSIRFDFLQRSGAPAVTRFSRGIWSLRSGKYGNPHSQFIYVVYICFIVFTCVLCRDFGQSHSNEWTSFRGVETKMLLMANKFVSML